MSRFDYNRDKFSVTFATSATTAVDHTIREAGMVSAIYVKTHTWPTPAAAASGASGGIVSLIDQDGNVLKTFTEVLTGLSQFILSASETYLLFPGDVVRYQISTTKNEPRVVSGASCIPGEFPTATVIIYFR